MGWCGVSTSCDSSTRGRVGRGCRSDLWNELSNLRPWSWTQKIDFWFFNCFFLFYFLNTDAQYGLLEFTMKKIHTHDALLPELHQQTDDIFPCPPLRWPLFLECRAPVYACMYSTNRWHSHVPSTKMDLHKNQRHACGSGELRLGLRYRHIGSITLSRAGENHPRGNFAIGPGGECALHIVTWYNNKVVIGQSTSSSF